MEGGRERRVGDERQLVGRVRRVGQVGLISPTIDQQSTPITLYSLLFTTPYPLPPTN